MSLPLIKISGFPSVDLMQTKWKSQIDPLIENPLTNGHLVKSVVLKSGVNTFNHFLGRNMIGWFLTDVNGPAQVFRSAPMNDKTLTLSSNAAATISIWVF